MSLDESAKRFRDAVVLQNVLSLLIADVHKKDVDDAALDGAQKFTFQEPT